jgi:hypothetical protein
MICRCAWTMAASSAVTGLGGGGGVGWPGAAGAPDEADEAEEAAAFADPAPAAVRPATAPGVTPAPGLADALAAGGAGERPQPLSTPEAIAMGRTRTEPSACLTRALANRRFIRVMVTVRAAVGSVYSMLIGSLPVVERVKFTGSAMKRRYDCCSTTPTTLCIFQGFSG